jgi:glycosyltransferase involved in cell wall biosynthesis
MKVLHLNTFEKQGGGAAIAAYRLHKSLLGIDVDSQMLVQNKFTDDGKITAQLDTQNQATIRRKADSLPKKLMGKSSCESSGSLFSLGCLPDSVPARINKINPDIVNIHWTAWGFLSVESLAKIDCPIVWTLHDMWAFTGGCHYAGDCKLYESSCANCPQMPPNFNIDLAKWVFDRKITKWQNLDITLVTPSKWLAKCVSSSSLFRTSKIQVISNSLDLDVYRPNERELTRTKLGLPQDKYLILFGAASIDTPYKGFHLLQNALGKLSSSCWHDKCELVIFGSTKSIDLSLFKFKTHYLGSIDGDDKLAALYNVADLFVSPSMQDNLPNVILESLACGTPCVAFNIGGMPDMIDHQINGYLATPFDPNNLAEGISWVLGNIEKQGNTLKQSARRIAEERFSMNMQANSYLQLYQSAIE